MAIVREFSEARPDRLRLCRRPGLLGCRRRGSTVQPPQVRFEMLPATTAAATVPETVGLSDRTAPLELEAVRCILRRSREAKFQAVQVRAVGIAEITAHGQHHFLHHHLAHLHLHLHLRRHRRRRLVFRRDSSSPLRVTSRSPGGGGARTILSRIGNVG